eukprot:1155106-Pelagomonas_calceolata.AAC.7
MAHPYGLTGEKFRARAASKTHPYRCSVSGSLTLFTGKLTNGPEEKHLSAPQYSRPSTYP